MPQLIKMMYNVISFVRDHDWFKSFINILNYIYFAPNKK